MPSFRGNYRDVFRPDSAATPVVPSARDSTTERGHYIDLARRHLLPCLKQENSAKWGIDNTRRTAGWGDGHMGKVNFSREILK